MGRVLGFGIYADPRLSWATAIGIDRELHDFFEGRNLEPPVERRIRGPELRQPLAGAQRLELGQREILGEPTLHGFAVDRLSPAPARELGMGSHVRRSSNLGFVTGNENPVARHDQIGLDVVRTLFDGPLVAGDRMFGPLPACTAMGDDDDFCRMILWHEAPQRQCSR